jgi:hypothetical protein
LFNSGRWTSSPDGHIQRGRTADWRDIKNLNTVFGAAPAG